MNGAAPAPSEIERTLRSEKLFSDTMIESMPGAVYFYDARGHFLRWNRNFEIVSGYSASDITRMQPLDFFIEADRPRVAARIAEVFERGESSVEAPFLARDGSTKPYFFTGRRVMFEGQSCLIGVGIDISDRIRSEHRLADSERKYRELVEQANSIILRWNSDGRIIFLNEFGQRFFGYSADEIVGRHVIDTIVPPSDSAGEDLAHLMEHICVAPQEYERNTNENVRRNGERVWIDWTNRIQRNPETQLVEILSVGTDITDRLRIEAEREQRLRAEEANRFKSAFLASMSHELRTPLNSIIGFTGIMLKGLAGPLNAEQDKQLGMVRTSARHLLALVNDVLDISKIEAGQIELATQPFDWRRSIEKVIALMQPQAQAKRVALLVEIAPALGPSIGDERRCEQILLNLVGNAIKFTDHGEVKLSADCLIDEAGASMVRLQIRDSGIGIRSEDLQSLFQPFRQVDSGLARKHEGTGLGLAICRRLAESMGGQIDVISEWGAGSTFTVILPLHAGLPT
jgi:PAS domain S-box-containing protein